MIFDKKDLRNNPFFLSKGSNKFPYEYDDYNELLWLNSNYGIQHIHPWEIQDIYETRIAQTTSPSTPTTTATTASTIPTLSTSRTFLKTGFKNKKLKKRQDFAIDPQMVR